MKKSNETAHKPVGLPKTSLVAFYVRCGKPGCKCAHEKQRHGPYYYNRYKQKGGRRSKHYIRAADVETAHQQYRGRKQQKQAVTASTDTLRCLRDSVRNSEQLIKQEAP
jgi:hypothetical protein